MPMLPPWALGLGFVAIGAALVRWYSDTDDKPGELGPDTAPTKTPQFKPTPNPTPSLPAPTLPSPQLVSWDAAVWGGGNTPMKWTAVRIAFQVLGWPLEGGALGGDPNGASCPEPGKGSRGACPASQQVKNFQAGINRAIDKANASSIAGAPIFAGQPKLVLDGILGANVLRALSRASEWQTAHGGGVFNPGSFRLMTL
jgi:hypothetical protein